MVSSPRLRLAAFAACVSMAALAVPVAPAYAGGLDLSFHGFYDPARQVKEHTQSDEFVSLMRELSLALGPRMAGPARSLGSLGLEAAYELSFVSTNSDARYWQTAAENPQPSVQTGTLRVRKGLPYGLQVGSVLTHLFESNMWAVGAELNMSLIDGFVNIPDVAARLSVHSGLGNSSLSLLIVGADFIVSKSFGIGGILSLEPWGGYSMAFTLADTHQIDVYPNDSEIKPKPMLLESVQEFAHRGVFGFRVVVTRVSIGFEFLRSFTDDLSIMTAKMGVDF